MAYTGARVSIPIGELGFTNIQNMSKSPIEGAIQAEGLEFVEGSVQREPGNAVFMTFPDNTTLLDIIEYYPTSWQQRFLIYTFDAATNAASLYKSVLGGAPSVIKSGLTISSHGSQFLIGGMESANRPKKVFLFNGVDPVQVVSGDAATTTNISKPPADWTGGNQPFFGIMHRNRVWAGGNMNDPHRIYVSMFADHEDFTGTLPADIYSISVFPGEGDGLCGGYSFNGRLFLFKRPDGIYWIDDTSINQNDWGVKKLVDQVGLANPNAIVETETDLIFLDPAIALYSLSTVQEFGEVRPRSLLEEFGVDRWLKDNYYLASPTWSLNTVPKLVWHHDKRQTILTFPKWAGGYAKLVLDYRFSPVKISYSFRDPALLSAAISDTDGKVRHIYGDVNKIYIGDQESRSAASKNGGAWPSKYQIPHTNLSFADSSLVGERIALEWLTIETTIFTEQTIMVDVFLDGTYKYTLSFVFSSTLSGFILDSNQLDEHQLGGGSTYTRTKRLRGTCERFSFMFYSNHPSANFVINDVLVSIRGNSAKLRKKP